MRIVCISDTHNRHKKVRLPEGDMLLHAGDFSGRGRSEEVKRFLKWFSAQPFEYKVFIAGNHDFMAEEEPDRFRSLIPKNCIYLEDNAVEIEGIRIWGSPITPWFHDWAFNRRRGNEIKSYWDKIDGPVDILITHGPPYGILDRTILGQRVGCEALLKYIQKNPPRIHLFGHIHEAYGQYYDEDTRFINASVVNLAYLVAHKPVIIDW